MKILIFVYVCLGIIGTKEYRKPEWVTHMEELQAALKGNETTAECKTLNVTISNTAMEKGRCVNNGENNTNENTQDCDLVICSYKEENKPIALHSEHINRLTYLKSHSDPLEMNTSTEDFDTSMIEYLNSRRHSHSSTREFKNRFQNLETEKPVSLEVGLEECYLESYYSESNHNDIEIVYIEDEEEDLLEDQLRKDSFCILSPIEENSERAETESAENESIYSSSTSNDIKKKTNDKTTKIPKIVSHSYDHIPISFTQPILQNEQSQTLPRAKIPQSHSHKEIWNSLRFPMEPRELDPEGYHQLHTADSQEELQEFLLLESECMTDGKNHGLASAFTVSDEGPRIFYNDNNDDRGTVSGINKLTLCVCFFVVIMFA